MNTKSIKILARGMAAFMLLVLLAGLLPGSVPAAGAAAGDTRRLSVSATGVEADDMSRAPAFSADGRYLAFESFATNLVSGDTNGSSDIFVKTISTGAIRRITRNLSRAQAINGDSINASLSGNGGVVAFQSEATNLIGGDTNFSADIFVNFHTLLGFKTQRISLSSSGAQGNYESVDPAISSDGNIVAFSSYATNLVSGDTNGLWDVFVRNRSANTTGRVSAISGGGQANGDSGQPSVSADGRYVAFYSTATNMVSGDTNGVGDVFVRDRSLRTTERVSISSSEEEANGLSDSPSISGDGRFVAFRSQATNLVSGDTNDMDDIFVRDRTTGLTFRASVYSGMELSGDSSEPAISKNGCCVAFLFDDHSGLGIQQVWEYNILSHITSRMSVDASGVPADDTSYHPTISGTGNLVAFGSRATNLVGDDSNGVADIFMHEISSTYSGIPSVFSITRLDPDFTAAEYVRYLVTFTESVTGVGPADFVLTIVSGGIRYASIYSVTGSGATRTVTIYTGHQDGTMRLDLIDDDTIKDASANPLGGVGVGNGDFTSGEEYHIKKSLVTAPSITSNANYDGYVTEAGAPPTDVGGSMNATETYFRVGDNALNQQFRAILAFNTASLPDDANIVRVTLKIKKSGYGTNTDFVDPFKTHGDLLVDIKGGSFGALALELSDFQSAASQSAVGIFENIADASNGTWTSALLDSAANQYINKTGYTQFRIRFSLDDDNDLIPDGLKFYTGNDLTSSNRPVLVVEYY
jgi:hypothetical protein